MGEKLGLLHEEKNGGLSVAENIVPKRIIWT
jgi:hypothetical protein